MRGENASRVRVYYTESKAAPESCHAALCAGCSGALAAQVTVKVIEFLSVSVDKKLVSDFQNRCLLFPNSSCAYMVIELSIF